MYTPFLPLASLVLEDTISDWNVPPEPNENSEWSVLEDTISDWNEIRPLEIRPLEIRIRRHYKWLKLAFVNSMTILDWVLEDTISDWNLKQHGARKTCYVY